MGGSEGGLLGSLEPTVKYHPGYALVLTLIPVNPGREQCQLGSLTGAVSSERVTEAREGGLKLVGNQLTSAKA